MSAATARPPLFNQLLASRPERDRGSLSATAMAVALHVALIVAAVTLTARIRAPAAMVDDQVIVLTPAVEQITGPNQPVHDAGGGSPCNCPAPPTLNWPEVTPPTIPAPGQSEIRAFEGPARQARPVQGTGAQAGPSEIGPPAFTPVTVAPRLLNNEELSRTLQRLYPTMLLSAGIGGTTTLWLRLDEAGRAVETQVKQSSGQRALDGAALQVGLRARFSPAYNRDQRVSVWVELPIVFVARD
jgi:TonB family protein